MGPDATALHEVQAQKLPGQLQTARKVPTAARTDLLTAGPRHCQSSLHDSPQGVRSAGSPGARKGHAGKYGELTPLRQRGGGGTPPPYPLAVAPIAEASHS